MAKQPIKIVQTDGTVDHEMAEEIASDIMKDIQATKDKIAQQSDNNDTE